MGGVQADARKHAHAQRVQHIHLECLGVKVKAWRWGGQACMRKCSLVAAEEEE